jgi:serine/threonine-protein kinase
VSSVSKAPLGAGQVLDGKYRIERVLGEGGMGVVVAATHLQLDQRVAIKALIPDATKNADAVERFSREARVAAKITSEHVVRVYDVGTLEGGEPYMVMEYLEGCDLKELLDEGPLSIGDACEYLLQSCEALAELHKAGIIHRDLKPANIYLTKRADGSPVIKLLDFGISKFTVHPDDPKLDPSMTATSAVMGSPGYMSPEQLKSTKDVDERADIWSLGTILYELLTGTPAFFGESMPQLCAMIVSEYPPLPSALRDDIPIALERAILRCLEKRPERRFADVGELAQILAVYAPERAQVSIDRIEGIIGSQGRRPPLSSRPPRPDSSAGIAALGEAQTEVVSGSPPIVRSTSSGNTRPERRSSALLFLLLIAASGVSIAVYTGKLDLRALMQRASGAVASTPPTPSASALTSSAPPPADPAPVAAPSASTSDLPAASVSVPVADAPVDAPPEASATAASESDATTSEDPDVDEQDGSAAPVASGSARPPPRYVRPPQKARPRPAGHGKWKRK